MSKELDAEKIVLPKIDLHALIEKLVEDGKLKGDPTDFYRNFVRETKISEKYINEVSP